MKRLTALAFLLVLVAVQATFAAQAAPVAKAAPSAQAAPAGEVKAKSFRFRVPDGWRVDTVPGSDIVALVPKGKKFVMTLHAGETGGQNGADLARHASRIKNGSDPLKLEDHASEAYTYTWITHKGDLATTMLFVNRGKALTLNIIGDVSANETETKNILRSLVSSDPAINEIAREFRRD